MKRTGSDGRSAAAQARQGSINGLGQSFKIIFFFTKNVGKVSKLYVSFTETWIF